MMAQPQAPSAGRHHFVDALRGWSLLGILIVNIEFIVQPSEFGWNNYVDGVDVIVRWLVIALGQTKIYPLFALLFGYGLSIQLRKAEKKGEDLWPRYRRRMIGIACLGVIHGVFFFPGDILVIYAAVGTACYSLRNRSNKDLLRIGVAVYAVASVLWLLVGLLDAVAFSGGGGTVDPEVVRVLSMGSFPEVVFVHFFYWVFTLGILALVQGPAVFALFLAGVALGRSQVLADLESHRHVSLQAMRWMPLGLGLAAVGATLTVIGGRWETLGFAIGFSGAPLMMAGYIALVGAAVRRFNAFGRVLQVSGRMSLTVYLMESAVASTLAYGYGVGLFGTVSPLAGVGWAALIWLGLSAFSVVWMRSFRFGPSEWALRSFTYNRSEPLRR